MLFICTAIFAGHYVDFITGFGLSKVIFGFGFLSLTFFNYRRILKKEGVNYIAFICVILLVISFSFWDYLTNVISYTGVLFAFIIYKSAPKEFLKMTTFFFYIIFIVASIEFLTKKYLFIPEVSIGGNEFLIIHESIGSVFRPKAFFDGALTLGYLFLLIGFLNLDKKHILFLCLIGTYLSGVRLALISLLAFLLLTGQFNYLIKSKYTYIILLILIIPFYFTDFGVKLFDQSIIDRISGVFDFKESNNFQRILYWLLGVDFYLGYDIKHLIFGNNGAFRAEYHNGTENGWLSLLVDNGILGFLFYLGIFFKFLFKKIQHNISLVLIMLIFIFDMFVTSFHLSRVTSIMIWVLIFMNWKNTFSEYKTSVLSNYTSK